LPIVCEFLLCSYNLLYKKCIVAFIACYEIMFFFTNIYA
jgi:hypothetical protein